jgi:hypothetical protein
MSYRDQTLKKLFALSGNVCAYPGCTAPIVDTDSGVVVGDICHIKGKSEGGPRYDRNQTDEERNGYENLLVMCVAHNRIVDGKKTRDQYPVERLQEFKRNHEVQYQGSVVNSDASNAFVEQFTVEGSVITTYNQSGGQTAHQITNVYSSPAHDEKEMEERAWALYSEFYKVSQEGYVLMPEPGSEQHRLAERLVAKGMLQRMPPGMGYAIPGQQFVLAPDPKNKARREALKKIYEAAKDLAGESGDPTDVIIFLFDEPASGRAAVHFPDSYNIAKFLDKHGLIVLENEDAMIVRLTDAGIRTAS